MDILEQLWQAALEYSRTAYLKPLVLTGSYYQNERLNMAKFRANRDVTIHAELRNETYGYLTHSFNLSQLIVERAMFIVDEDREIWTLTGYSNRALEPREDVKLSYKFRGETSTLKIGNLMLLGTLYVKITDADGSEMFTPVTNLTVDNDQ